jgi:beta-N-acetylhexosaminidase
MIDLEGDSLSERERDWLTHGAVGGVILFSRNFRDRDQLRDLVGDIHAIRNPPLLVAVDQEGGRIQRFRSGFSTLPPMRAIGRLFDQSPEVATQLATQVGWLMAAELRACGVDLSFAPVVDVDRGLAEVIGDRAFHSSAAAVAELAGALMRGMRSGGMMATAKHFPTHAGALADSHKALAIDNRDYAELIDDLEPYRQLIAAGLHAVMVCHVVFPRLDSRPASLSDWWINAQLRRELGFTGAVISDDLSMQGLSAAGGIVERATLALEAGSDMVLVCNDTEAIPRVLDALDDYNNPAAQLRLMRLRGAAATRWDDLVKSVRWAQASSSIGRLDVRPTLELES